MELFIHNDEVWCKSEKGMERLDESNLELIDSIMEKIQEFYPSAYEALTELYSRPNIQLPYFKYLCVRRFCKCNFGVLDATVEDIGVEGCFHFEKVSCPLRGECKYDGCLCMPAFNSTLSDAEMRVMRLFYDGKNANEIAEELFLSLYTVKNHKHNAYKKLGVTTKVDFIRYANENNLFK